MIRKLALRTLWAHKRRLVGSFLAVFLGTSFLSGALVLADTLGGSINRFLDHAYEGTDVVVRNSTAVSPDSPVPRGSIDSAAVARVRGVPGVATAEPVIEAPGQLLGKDGAPLDVMGPRLAGNWVTDPQLNPYQLVEGRAPSAAGEVVVNKALAKLGKYEVGDAAGLVAARGRTQVRIVGISKFGSEDAFGGSSFTAFTLVDAQRLVAPAANRVTRISVRAANGVGAAELARNVQPVLPAGAEAITGKQLAEDAASAVNKSFVTLFRTFLLVFAGVALLVGTFTIANTFSIIVMQRSRESAMLRAVGATRRQVLTGVTTEALGIGLVASIAGVLGGLGFATALKAMFSAFGLGLPAEGLSLGVLTVVLTLVVGVLVTLVASLVPAVRASRIPPLAALRDTSVEKPGVSWVRRAAGYVLGLVALGLVIGSAFAPGSAALAMAGAGAVPAIIALVLLGPVGASRAAAVGGAPVVRLRGVSAQLARDNAMRSPRRTAGAATALMVGVTVVTLLTVMAATLKQSVTDSAERAFGGDLALSAGGDNPYAGFSPKLAQDLSTVPEVGSAVGISQNDVLVEGKAQSVAAADPAALAGVVSFDVVQGDVAALRPDQLAVAEDVADDKGWRPGSAVRVTFPDGTAQPLTVGAVYEKSDLVGPYLLHRATAVPHSSVGLDNTVLISLKDGVDLAAGKAAVERAVTGYGVQGDVQDREEFAKAQSAQMDTLLGMVYVMLALTILISLLGISNTLSLAVHERTREIGLLRAVGATRRQVRSSIRWESVLIALFGTAGGLVLGALLGWALARGVALASTDHVSFAAPVGQLIVVLLVGVLAGVLAAIRPARRAARMRLLDAITYA